MFWADKIAEDIIASGKHRPYWVDDMKTPSGRIHVGGLRAVATHDLVYKALLDAGVKAKFTYVFDNHDPMDSLPNYLPKEYEKYLGTPLFLIPSPKKGFDNYAEYFAKEFQDGFKKIDCDPEIIWTTDLYFSGRMNPGIKTVLDNTDKIKKIYEDLYEKKLPQDWYPFNAYCPSCNKVSTTKVTGWDGKVVAFECRIDGLDWTKGCGFKGNVSPFATKERIAGKLPWKVEWALKWQVIGITVEGAGKDHMTKGGSHDLAKRVCEEVLDYRTPYAFSHEFFLVGGKKMSSSKGFGISVGELLDILPPEVARFLIARTKLNQAINFDPYGNTIPDLFDDFQKGALEFENHEETDKARAYEISNFTKKTHPKVRFSTLAQWVQMPNMEEEIKDHGLEEWAPYAGVWLDKFAPEEQRFTIQKKLPNSAKELNDKQKELLKKASDFVSDAKDGEELQTKIYALGKELGLSSGETFEAFYKVLIGKNHGPKLAWLLLSLDEKFVQERLLEASK